LEGVLVKEVERYVRGLLEGLRERGEEIKVGLRVLGEGKQLKEGEGERRMQLVKTGRVWDSCDQLVALSQSGLVGVVAESVKRWGDLVKDAEEELKSWVLRCSVDSGNGSGDEEDDGWGGDDGDEEELDEDEKKIVDRVSKRVRSTCILFFAVGKRRLLKGDG